MEGIENIELKDIKIANQLNLRIKLLGISEIINNKLFEAVHPCLVSKNSYIGKVNGVMNAVILQGKPVGENIFQGEGAGPGPAPSPCRILSPTGFPSVITAFITPLTFPIYVFLLTKHG